MRWDHNSMIKIMENSAVIIFLHNFKQNNTECGVFFFYVFCYSVHFDNYFCLFNPTPTPTSSSFIHPSIHPESLHTYIYIFQTFREWLFSKNFCFLIFSFIVFGVCFFYFFVLGGGWVFFLAQKVLKMIM